MKNVLKYIGFASLILLVYTIFLNQIPVLHESDWLYGVYALGILVGFGGYLLKSRFLSWLLMLSILPIIALGQDADGFVVQNAWDGFQELFAYVNVPYIFVYMALAWLVNDFADVKVPVNKRTWWTRIRKTVVSFIVGVVVLGIYAFFFNYNTKEQYFSLVVSLILAMVIYKFGINQIFAWISNKIGLKIKKEE